MRAAASEFAGDIPLILKLNNHDLLHDENDPASALTGSVRDALPLGCVGIGFTIYPGSARSKETYEQLRAISEEARAAGLAVVVWSYPRGLGLSKEGETALDVVAYAAQIAAQLGAHIIKVKLPSEHLERPEAEKMYIEYSIARATLAEHFATSCKVRSTDSASSFSREAFRWKPKLFWKKRAPFATAVVSARLSGATHSSVRTMTASPCCAR